MNGSTLALEIARVLRAWGRSETDADITSAMDKIGSHLTAQELLVRLEGQIDEALFYLPSAFEYVRRAREGYSDIIGGIVRFVKVWERELFQTHMINLIIGKLQRVLYEWTMTFPLSNLPLSNLSENDIGLPRYVAPTLDECLNYITTTTLIEVPTLLFDRVVVEWLDVAIAPNHSANVIDFIVRVRCFPDQRLEMYRDRRILDRVFDNELILKHWQYATEVIANFATLGYQSLILKWIIPQR